MNITAIEFEREISEPHEAGLTLTPSFRVKPPRIAESPVSMECELMQIIEFSPENALVLGRIVAMHVRDDAVLDAAKQQAGTRGHQTCSAWIAFRAMPGRRAA